MLCACIVSTIASPSFQDTGGSPRFDSVHVVFVEEHSHAFVSGFGHLFVVLSEGPVSGVDDLLGAPALNFGADTSPLGKGMWVGEYKLQPCHELVRKNTRFDQRRLTVFELGLSSELIEGLQRDLGLRLSREYPYDFVRHNCGHYIWDWLNGPSEDERALLYLTPREALGKILALYPPVSIRCVGSDLEILEDRLRRDTTTSRSVLKAALRDPTKLREIQDLETRLLAIKVAESEADRDAFQGLQKLRADTLNGKHGAEAAQRVIELQLEFSERSRGVWKDEGEGPAMALATSYYPDSGRAGVRLMGEAGLRDAFTEPRQDHAWRVARFLSVTLEAVEGDFDASVVLASISTLRDARSLLGGASNGVELGFSELPSALGTSGLYFSTWGGLATKTNFGWVGARLSFVGDGLDGRADARVLPGLSWDLLLPEHAAHLELHHRWGDSLGWQIKHDLILSRRISIRSEWVRTPDRQNVLSFSVQTRF